jgi:hypothetical protein
MTMGSTQSLTELSTRNLSWGQGRPARKGDKLTAISESLVYKMWDPQRLTTLWTSTACYMDRFTFIITRNSMTKLILDFSLSQSDSVALSSGM